MALRAQVLAAALLLAIAGAAAAQDAPADVPAPPAASDDVTTLALVNVVGVSPVAGTTLDARKLPYAVQSSDDRALEAAQPLGLADFMAGRLAGVTTNAAQNNPLQPDLAFRGFTATPLLGGAQGLAVYLDGVRVNEVFGDTVNWDLVPTTAIERLSLVAGANPVFGLNALGGAVSIETRTGFSDPGASLSLEGGAFGRARDSAQVAGNNGGWGWYLMADRFREDGWRDASPSDATTGYGTLSWRGDAASLDLHLGHAETDLTGNGPAPAALLDERWQAVFTAPDETANTLDVASLEGDMVLGGSARLAFSAFHRRVGTRSYNGDASEFDDCDEDEAILCDEDGEPVLDQAGEPLPTVFDAINNIGRRRQGSHGGTLQFDMDAPLGGRANQFVLGLDLLDGWLDYASVVEAATLQADRHTSSGSGRFVAADALRVQSHSRAIGLYATDTLSLTERFALTVSARANRSRIAIHDPTGTNPDLDGRHGFFRVNPAAGLTWQWTPAVNAYGGYSEATRTPTPVELTCADEDAPCKLPNQFLSDPPLDQVVARSWEGGLRGVLGDAGADHLAWRVGLFRTTNTKDILFQATGGTQSNEGFFANVGDTRRQGLEATLNGRSRGGRLSWFANYALLRATFLTAFDENSAHHPAAGADGRIHVARGDRIPGLPRHSLKLGAEVALGATWRVGGELQAQSGQTLRGDEAGRLDPVPGFAVVNLDARWDPTPRLGFFARIDNLFDRRYATFGALGDASEVIPGISDPRFLGPAPPRGAWVGLRVRL
jgi:outer membrane receptor protein involved in Fe transport